MPKKSKTTGLSLRNGIYHIDKQYRGVRLRGSCQTRSYDEALEVLAQKMKEVIDAERHGIRPKRSFMEAATHYLTVKTDKRSIDKDTLYLEALMPFIGELAIDQVNNEALSDFINHKKKSCKNGTVNRYLEVIRHILNLCTDDWKNEYGQTWLERAPKIKMLPESDKAKPYPLNKQEQRKLIGFLPKHLKDMVRFKVNTGTREQEVCQLRWDWEYELEDTDIRVFEIPKEFVKNGEPRLVVLNYMAKLVIEAQRGKHDTFVFVNKQGNPLQKMNNTPWKRAWRKADLPTSTDYNRGVHNLKHTFGQRLRSAGVSLEDRKTLLGHKICDKRDITSHYSAPEIRTLIELANKALRVGKGKSSKLRKVKPQQ